MAEYFDPVDPYGQLNYGDEDELAYFLKVQKEEEQKRKSSGINKAANIGGQLGGAYVGNQAVSGLMSLGSSSGVGAAGSAAPIATASTPTTVLPSMATDLGAAGTTGMTSTGGTITSTGAVVPPVPPDGGSGLAALGATALPLLAAGYGTYAAGKTAVDLSDPDYGKDAGKGFSEGWKKMTTPENLLTFGLMGGPIWGGLYGAGAAAFGSGKDIDQVQRDKGRSALQDLGLLTDDYKLNYGSNRDFNIGYDGGDQEAIIREEDGRKLHNYDIDWSRKGISDVAEAVRPIAMMVSGGNQKLGEDITGYMVNKALMSGDPTKDVMDLYGSAGINFDTGHARLLEMEQSGALTKEQADALRFQLTRYLGQGTFKDQSGGNPMTFNVGDVNTSGRVLGDGEFVDAPVPVIAQPKDINPRVLAEQVNQKLQEKQK